MCTGTCTSNCIFKSDYLFLSQIKQKANYRGVPYDSDKEWEFVDIKSTSLKPKSDIAIPQILKIGCQSAREFGLAYKFGAARKLKIFSKIFCSCFLFLFFLINNDCL